MPSYTREQLELAVKDSTSFRQVLLNLGLSPQGGNNATVQRFIKKWNIDTEHFLGAPQKGMPKRTRTEISTYLNNEKPIGSFRLKNRLIRENILRPICSQCENTNWLGRSIPLELDHVDGNNENNNLSNLRLLCPNCHALTSTYRGKNQKRAK
jgi:hypothetical protein